MDDYRGVMIKKGTKLRVSFLKEGVTNGKKWQFFIFNNTKKEFDKDTFVAIQRYTVFIENPRENLLYHCLIAKMLKLKKLLQCNQ